MQSLGDTAFEWKYSAPIGYAGVPAHTLVPIFPAASMVEAHVPSRPQNALIQGNIHPFRRDYVAIFKSLEAQLLADPKLWGYKAVKEEGADVFVYDGECKDPFKLILLGQLWKGEVFFPEQLRNVVQIMDNVRYDQYYQEISKADLIIPAFARPHYFCKAALAPLPPCCHNLLTTSRFSELGFVDYGRSSHCRHACTCDTAPLVRIYLLG